MFKIKQVYTNCDCFYVNVLNIYIYIMYNLILKNLAPCWSTWFYSLQNDFATCIVINYISILNIP